jgi:uncharacterized repeat protein (TIGR01451 family)
MRDPRNGSLPIAVAAVAFILGAAQLAGAVGTASGTSVANAATVDYQVGGIDQDTVTSNTVSFVVDNMVDLTVATTDGAAVPVTPGSADQVLTYTVTNNGNTVQDYSLAAQAASGAWGGATDNFDADSVRVFVDSNGNGTYDPVLDTGTYIDELAADASVSVFIVANIPIARANGDGALYDLIAQTAQGGSSGSQGADILTDDSAVPDNPATIEIVFADGAGPADAVNDGRHSSRDAYLIDTATLGVVKTSVVVDDPVNGTTNPKAIPGATVRYTITVTNSGDEDATSVVLVDQIPVNTAYAPGTIELDSTPLTDAADADEGDYNVTNPGAVTVAIGTISQGGGSTTVTFDVTVD